MHCDSSPCVEKHTSGRVGKYKGARDGSPPRGGKMWWFVIFVVNARSVSLLMVARESLLNRKHVLFASVSLNFCSITGES